MTVVGVCQHVWGKTYFGYGRNGFLFTWGVDSAGQFDLMRCTTSYMYEHLAATQ